jgi:hypothetical protein
VQAHEGKKDFELFQGDFFIDHAVKDTPIINFRVNVCMSG